MHVELTRELVESLRVYIQEEDPKNALKLIKDLHPADISEIFRELSIDEAKFLYVLLEDEKAADVIIEMEEDEREQFLKIIPGDVIAKQFIDNMDSDDAVDVLQDLSKEKKEEVLKSIEDVEQAGDIVDLLGYDEDSAGGLMAKELIKVKEEWDVTTCLREMRRQAKEVDEVYYVYVTDEAEKLIGTISLKRLLLTRSNATIKNLANTNIISVNADTKSEEVASIMRKYDLIALPVVDPIGRLIGRITIDDVVDVISDEAEKDYQLMSGITEDIEPTDKIPILTRARLPWLLVGMLGGMVAAVIISQYETDLGLYPQMAFFIPLIAAMGGNVGVQSSALVVQSLANKTLDFQGTGKKILKEIGVALINGVILSGIAMALTLLVNIPLSLVLTVSIALFSVILFASVFGTIIPLTLNKFNIDPALATGPFITTLNDIAGLVFYLGIGRILYGLFH